MSNDLSTLRRALLPLQARGPALHIPGRGERDQAQPALIENSHMSRIAVVMDGSPLGELAIPYARGLARLANAKLQLALIRESTLTPSRPEYLQAIATRLGDADVRFANSLLFNGSNAARRFSEAAEGSIDLIVVATRRRSALSRACWSSLADRILQSTSVPVLIVRGSIPPSDLHWSPPLRRILVPLVGPAMQCEGLSTVAEIGELTNGTQTLLRILPIETNSVGSGDRKITLKVNALAEAEDDLKRAGGSLPRPVTKMVFSNSRLEDVVRFETIANETDLIAVAANGRSPLKRWLAPELFDYLLQDTGVPVLVFRPTPGK